MITLDDVAKEARVSTATVSIVVNDRHFRGVRVSPATRERVLDVARQLGYTPNSLARAVATGKNRVFGFIKDDFDSELSMRIMVGAQEEGEAQDYLIKPFRLNKTELAKDVITRCLGQRVAGMILVNLADEALEIVLRETEKAHLHVVTVDTPSYDGSCVNVRSDAAQGIRLAIEHLAGLGHKRIGFIAGPAGAIVSEERKAYFFAACKELGIGVPDNYVVDSSWGDYEPVEGAVSAILSSGAGRRPTALFCAGDPIAMMTIKAARRGGLVVPRDLSIVGYSNASFAYLSDPSLTTVAQDFVEMGRVAVRYLLEVTTTPNHAAATAEIKLPATLIVRELTAPPSSSGE